MLESHFPPHFLGTCSQWMSSIGSKILCIVGSFIVLRSSCRSFSVLLLKNGPADFTSGTVYVFIPLMGFLQLNFVSSSYLVFLSFLLLVFRSSLQVCKFVLRNSSFGSLIYFFDYFPLLLRK